VKNGGFSLPAGLTDNLATSSATSAGRTSAAAPARGRGRARLAAGFALVLLASAAVLSAAVLAGPAHISLGEVVAIVWRRLLGQATGFGWRETVVIGVRMPRALVGFVVGGGLAVSGAALQGLFRNPLAEPGVLGISSGASLGAVLAIYFHVARRAVWTIPIAAFLGAAVDAIVVFGIAARRGRGRLFTGTLLLVGVAVGALNI